MNEEEKLALRREAQTWDWTVTMNGVTQNASMVRIAVEMTDEVPWASLLMAAILSGSIDGHLTRVKARKTQRDSHVQYCAEIAQQNGLRHSTWSISDTMFTEPHPYPGARMLQYDGTGDVDGIFRPIEGPTWFDLWKAADAALGQSADKAHRYIEDFDPDEADPTVLHLITGS